MRQFIKTNVPAEGYEQVKKNGEVWIVHLEPSEVDQQTGTLTCYECTTDSEPDIVELTAELQEWKAYTADRELVIKKQVKTEETDTYDSSENVNGFIIRTAQGDITAWLDTEKRGNAQRAIDAAKKTGVSTLEYVIGGVPVVLTVEDADLKLAQIEMYAVQCTAVTERHRAAINALETVEEVEAYDFTQGYPQRLVFNV